MSNSTAGRPQFNARVTEAKHRFPAFQAENFTHFLIGGVDPLVQAVDKVAPDYCSRVMVVAYDIALNLVGRDLAGPHIRSQNMNKLWREIFPALALQITQNPQLILGALSNALVNIEALANARPEQWLEMMKKLAPRAESGDQLLSIGMLAAWCSGAAHFRQAALRAAATLPQDLVVDAMGVVDKKISLDALLQNLENNPWWLLQVQTASGQLNQKEVGSFSGFGGYFSEPPQVRVNGDGFVVKSGDRFNILIADAYGAVFLPVSEEEFKAATQFLSDDKKSARAVLQGSRLSCGNKMLELNFPSEGLALVCNEHTIALTSPYSFAITLIPR
jgi:hypothetical protein